jgi:hypothetical protein
MTDTVIFNSPYLVMGYVVALFFCLFAIKRRGSGYIIPIISTLLCVGTSAVAIILGASYYEICIVILIFLFLNIYALLGRGGKNK